MGGVHLHVDLVPVGVAVAANEGEAVLGPDRRRDLRPLGHPGDVDLQAQHALVEHVLAGEAQHRPGSPVAPHDSGGGGVDEIDRVGHVVEQGGGFGQGAAVRHESCTVAWKAQMVYRLGRPGAPRARPGAAAMM